GEIAQNDAQEASSYEEEEHETSHTVSEQQGAETQEIEATRIGSAKLRAILRSYKAYLSSVEQRKKISRREQQLIREIGELHALILAYGAEGSDSLHD